MTDSYIYQICFVEYFIDTSSNPYWDHNWCP